MSLAIRQVALAAADLEAPSADIERVLRTPSAIAIPKWRRREHGFDAGDERVVCRTSFSWCPGALD